ncbi:MAG: patatin-like phospholipase family protein [Pseudomonadota bacterium]
MSASFTALAGARAARHVREQGLRPADIACIPAAAGGPKGLALIPLDTHLFGSWLRDAPHVELIGASIGAWRMFAAAQVDPVAALARLAESYIEQRYPRDPTPGDVSAECRKLARAVLCGERMPRFRDNVGLSLITTRARGVLDRNGSRAAFARAALANARSRVRLAAHMQRVLFDAGDARFPAHRFDAFGLERVRLAPGNCEDALLASGSIPLVCEPVRDPAGAARGDYWDGGLIDYHLVLPYHTLGGVVLYPHFVPYVTPGWLDKFLPWRKRARAHPWLDNVLLIAPSREFLARLPGGRLPERQDFHRYGLDHAARIRAWRRAIGECERFADEVMAWLERPDPTRLAPL